MQDLYMKYLSNQRGNRRSYFSQLMLLLTIIFGLQGCIEPFDARVDEDVDLISIEGSIIKGQPVQNIVVSRTTSLIYPQYRTIRQCNVVVVDDLDKQYRFNENPDGTYSLEIPDEELVFNREYQLQVTTPTGEYYESPFEALNGGSEVDTVYYSVEDKVDKLTGDNLIGLQFYVDLEAADSVSRYFRWNLIETYEYISQRPISYYFADESLVPMKYLVKDEYQYFRCWRTARIPSLFLSSTENLTVNEKKKIPLNYVSNMSDRLAIKYSLFVEQYTLSESAYKYWQRNKIATQESGGLYTQQPGQPVTNIRNVNDPSEEILGFFWVSHKTTQRIFVPRISSLPVITEPCELVEFNAEDHGKGPFPVYIYVDVSGALMTGNPQCFVCTLKGGTTVKPEFWQ